MSTVIEDLKRLEERILARIKELEANDAELEHLRITALLEIFLLAFAPEIRPLFAGAERALPP